MASPCWSKADGDFVGGVPPDDRRAPRRRGRIVGDQALALARRNARLARAHHPRLLGGSFIVESYFAVPGIGWTLLSAVRIHDLPTVQGILSVVVVVSVLVFILVDVGYSLIDPDRDRVRSPW
jgi:hypothetical protein